MSEAQKVPKKQTKKVDPKKVAVKKSRRAIIKPHGHIQKRFPKLYVRAIFTGYKRQKHTQHSNIALLKLENVGTRDEAYWYVGKKVAYVAKSVVSPSRKLRRYQKRTAKITNVIWGKIRRVHGASGMVKAAFKSNLPPKAIGGRVRVMLYPSNI